MNKEINNNGYDYVDLGLPSGTFWATCNVGSDKLSEYGLYFQWGDIEGYAKEEIGKDKQFTWNDYKFNPSGDRKTFTKYKIEAAKLDLEDDAAHVNMGGDWHMPSPEQIKELLRNTTSTWVALDGVNGMTFTSKKDDSKSIFIPAAGDAWDGSVRLSGDYGLVWSSMLYTDFAYGGQYLSFDSGYAYLYCSSRYYGFSVRGVIG